MGENAGGWRIAGTSVTGPDHRLRGESCQDDHHVEVTEAGAVIAVVSDGAGSTRHGGLGASVLCASVAQGLRSLANRPYSPHTCSRTAIADGCRAVRDAIHVARRAVLAQTEAGDTRLSDYQATLVGGILLPDGGGLTFHIGDGAAVAMTADGSQWQMSGPHNGEFADTTYFFTDDHWWRSLRFTKIRPEMDTLFVMTDGVTDLGLSRSAGSVAPHMPFFRPIATFLAAHDRDAGETALIASLESPSAIERTRDDKTLVWAARTKS